MNILKSEDLPTYQVEHLEPVPLVTASSSGAQYIIKRACELLASQLKEPGACIDSPEKTRQFLTLELAKEDTELFCVMFLDTRHRVIQFERMFRGTIDGCSVHPREVARACLQHNAAAVIIAHNHPSGEPEPSRADISLTKRLVEALALLDIRVLDHIVIGGTFHVSFAEKGLI
jgi:DNA repair protein RadC